MSPGPFTLLPLLGCIQNGLKGAGDGDGVGDSGDSYLGSDTERSDSVDDTSASSCSDAPTDANVPSAATCASSFDGDLRVRWTAATQHAAGIVAVAPATDDPSPLNIWIQEGSGVYGLYSADGARISEELPGDSPLRASTADLDPGQPGAEYFISFYDVEWEGPEHVGLVNATSSLLWQADVSFGVTNLPWLADLEGDGRPEALLGNSVLDATNGQVLGQLEGIDVFEDLQDVAADLDGDGIDTIVSAGWEAPIEVSYFHPDGTRYATCFTSEEHSEHVVFGVANLDEDREGEVVAAGTGFVVVCDSDGTLLAESDLGAVTPALVGIGELDGDAGVEIVISGSNGIVAADADLTTKWTYGDHEPNNSPWYAFSLADLNGDGAHEVLVHDEDILVVLDGASGSVAASLLLPEAIFLGNNWKSQPVVADADGDGTAEILVSDQLLVCVEDGTGTGWVVEGAGNSWPGPDHFPGDRDSHGAIPAPSMPWLTPGQNVWQGLAAPGIVARAELGVSITDVCVESCETNAVVTVEVFNSGLVDVATAVTVSLLRSDTGASLGETTLPGIASGVGTFVQFTTAASAVQGGLVARVVPSDGVVECGDVPNEDLWIDANCP